MSPNSQAYRDAWARAREAIVKELFATKDVCTENAIRHISSRKKVEYVIDDLASATAKAVLGIEDDTAQG